MTKIIGLSLIQKADVIALSASAAREAIKAQAAGLVDLAMQQVQAKATFGAFERLLMVELLALARAVLSLFLAASEERVRRTLGARVARDGRNFRRAPAQQRGLLTWFGLV